MYLFEIGTLSCFFVHVYGCGEAFPECWVAGNSHFFFSFLLFFLPCGMVYTICLLRGCGCARAHFVTLWSFFGAVLDTGVLSCSLF